MAETPGTAVQSHESSGRLGPADVQAVLFSRSGLGRRGYDEAEVDIFLDRVQTELSRLIGERAALRDQVARLERQLADQPPRSAHDEASAKAVSMLSAAQQTADQYIADAESYSKRLTREARERYEQVVADAAARAAAILEEAERAGSASRDEVVAAGVGNSELTKAELEEQVAYLRTFSQVCRVQLRAYLEALLRDVEVEWGRAHPGVVPAPAQERVLVDDRPVVERGAVRVAVAADPQVPGELSAGGGGAEDRALLKQ